MSKQSKRARFYARQRKQRIVDRITKKYCNTPGFAGVVFNLQIFGHKPLPAFGPGALFLNSIS